MIYCIMRRLKLILLVLAVMAMPAAQAKDIFVGLTSQGSNLWFTPMQVPVYLINALLGGGASGLTYDWLHVSGDGTGRPRVDNGSYFGFRARDMFNNFGIGLQITYQPQYSIFGIWVKGGYKYRQFRLYPDENVEEYSKYKANGWNLGLGVRLTPFRQNLERGKIVPYLEFGTSYNDVFKVTAPYDNDKSQFGKGMSTTFGIGMRRVPRWSDQSWNCSLTFTLPHYNYLDRSYTLPDGTRPYEYLRSKTFSITLAFQREF